MMAAGPDPSDKEGLVEGWAAGLAASVPGTDARLLAEVLRPLCRPARRCAAGTVLCEAGRAAEELFIPLEGWLAEVVGVEADKQQIVDILLPFDVTGSPDKGGAQSFDLVALSPAVVLPIPLEEFVEVISDDGPESPQSAALRTFVRGSEARRRSALRQQVVRNGRRSARARVGHLLLELYERLRIKELAAHDTFDLPVGQSSIADALGLSYVHVSRVLTHLERSGMIDRRRATVAIKDRPGLTELSGFDPHYLNVWS